MCGGENEDGSVCSRAISNRMRDNDCLSHSATAPLKSSGKCPAYFIYIRPFLEDDNRRWLGIASACPSTAGDPSHNHPEPIESKLDSSVKEDISKAVRENPSYTTDDFSKGIALGYNPICKSIAAAKKSTLSNFVNSARVDLCGNSARHLIENFNQLVKADIDERDSKEAEDVELVAEVLKDCTPYLR